MDEYQTSIREIEKRIASARARSRRAAQSAQSKQPDMPRPPAGIPDDVAQHMTLMWDLLVLAFQADVTASAR